MQDNKFKKPNDMNDMELLETYSHYTKLSFRLKDEQDYIGDLRAEILKRMESNNK